MPNKNTFDIKPIKTLIEKYYSDRDKNFWLNPYSGKNKYGVTNDLNPEFGADYNLDALEFLKQFKEKSINGILFDPPYSPRQVSECYKGFGVSVTNKTTRSSFWSKQKYEISRLIKRNGICITFGWNSGGIGKTNGFEIVEILLAHHGGWHNDTICTVEKKLI
jgi:hypothetical protein